MKLLPDSFKAILPDDHSRQVISTYYVDYLFSKDSSIKQVMDLGCGTGTSTEQFQEKNRDIKWVGLDIVKSPEIESQIGNNIEFHLFDGIHMPFDNDHFDLIFCNQVFEHVRYPAELLKEALRVLKPGSYLIGSTSQLEPYHSLSMWNYTPYGFSLLLEEGGFQVDEIRPSIDALTLIIRYGLGSPGFFTWFWKRESPLNFVISAVGLILRKRPSWINLIKLLFCGQFCFMARKPE